MVRKSIGDEWIYLYFKQVFVIFLFCFSDKFIAAGDAEHRRIEFAI